VSVGPASGTRHESVAVPDGATTPATGGRPSRAERESIESMPLCSPFYAYAPGKGPSQVGVYELAWTNSVRYVGSGTIRRRLQAHDRDDEKSWRRYRCLVTNDRRRAVQIERREQRRFRRRHGALPKYNEQVG
jgi:hypothetical protein